MSKTLGGILLLAVGKLNFKGSYKACNKCLYQSSDCRELKHCQTASQAEGVVWHIGDFNK